MLFINTLLAVSLSLSHSLCLLLFVCLVRSPALAAALPHTQSPHPVAVAVEVLVSAYACALRSHRQDKTQSEAEPGQSRFSPWPRAAAATSIQFLLAE